MARLIVSQHIKSRANAPFNQLAVEPDMIEVTVQDKHRAPTRFRVREPEIVHHNLVTTRLDIALVIIYLRMLDPEIKAVKTAVGDHLLTQFP